MEIDPMFPLLHLPKENLISLLQRIKPRTRFRLRRTCHKIDDFVERNRFIISKNPTKYKGPTLQIYIHQTHFEICTFLRRSRTIHKPFQQLSAARFWHISLYCQGTSIRRCLFEQLAEVLRKCSFFCYTLNIDTYFNEERALDFVPFFNAYFLEMHFPIKISFNRIFSSKKPMNVRKLKLHNGRFGLVDWTDFPEQGVLERAKNFAEIPFGFVAGQENLGIAAFRRFLVDLENSTDLGNLQKVQFKWRKTVDLSSLYSSNYVLAYNSLLYSHHDFELCLARNIYLLKLPKNFVLIAESDNFRVHQAINIRILEKDVNALKKEFYDLTKTIPAAELLNYVLRSSK